jgi:hypothetical protein
MDPFTIGALVSGVGALGKVFAGAKQNRLANQINPIFQQYQQNPLAQENLAVNKNMFYGADPASFKAQSNVMQAQANQLASAQRGATDASQLLAVGAGLQGGTNEAFSKLAAQEAEGKAGLLGSLNQAYRGVISEGDKAYNSMMQKFQMDAQAKAALRQSGMQNIFGGIGDIGAGAMQFGMLKKNPNLFTQGLGAQGFGTQGFGTQGYPTSGYNPMQSQNLLFGTGNMPSPRNFPAYRLPNSSQSFKYP